MKSGDGTVVCMEGNEVDVAAWVIHDDDGFSGAGAVSHFYRNPLQDELCIPGDIFAVFTAVDFDGGSCGGVVDGVLDVDEVAVAVVIDGEDWCF